MEQLSLQAGKYSRVERERRFLLARLPVDEDVVAVRRIVDRYLVGTHLRLRRMATDKGPPRPEFKLTQKVPAVGSGAVQGTITNVYLSRVEHDLLAIPAAVLTKTRHSVPPLGIDVFDPPLDGLILAEAEFATDADVFAFSPPDYVVAEVTDDPRFTGGRLAVTPRDELSVWLHEYGITLTSDVESQRSP